MLHVVNCLVHTFQRASAALLSVVPYLRVLSLLHVARSPLHGVCCLLPQPPVSHAGWCALPVACPMSHLVTVHVAALRVVCRMLHDARPLLMLSLGRWLSQLARCVSHAVCWPLQSDTAPSHTQRIAAAHRN